MDNRVQMGAGWAAGKRSDKPCVSVLALSPAVTAQDFSVTKPCVPERPCVSATLRPVFGTLMLTPTELLPPLLAGTR